MMSPIETMMRDWLTHPDPLKRSHAAARIAIGFDAPPPAELPALAQAPAARALIRGSVYRALNTCLYRDCKTGCQLTRCWAGRGDRDGGTRTTLARCESCVTTPGDPP